MASRVFAIAGGRSATIEGDFALVASFTEDSDGSIEVGLSYAGIEEGDENMDVYLALMLASFAESAEATPLFLARVSAMAQVACNERVKYAEEEQSEVV